MWKALVLCLLALPVQAQEITQGEMRLMGLVFDDCLGFVRGGSQPFRNTEQMPVSDQTLADLPSPARAPGATARHILNERYTAIWGQDETARFCMMVSNSESTADMMFLVDPNAFLDRVTAQATAAGLTQHEPPEEFSPIHISLWHEPGTYSDGIRLVILPTADRQDQKDVGYFIVGGPPITPLS